MKLIYDDQALADLEDIFAWKVAEVLKPGRV
jgi:uncharacterized tellurite resistance protein B-like protein